MYERYSIHKKNMTHTYKHKASFKYYMSLFP